MIDTNEMRTKGDLSLLEIHDLCDEIDRLRAKPKPQGKTVRAEAFYAVNKSGYYRILGILGDSETQEYCRRDVCNDAAFDDGPVAFGTITADLHIPEETTVEAEVENGNS